MYHGHFDMPTFAYFNFGNTWTGSLLGSFNYRVEPQPKNDPPQLLVNIWYGGLCFEKSDMADTFTEEFSEEGYARVLDKLNEQVEEYMKAVK